MEKEKLRYYAPVVVCLLLIALLLTVPTGFEAAVQYQEAQRCIAEILRWTILPSWIRAWFAQVSSGAR